MNKHNNFRGVRYATDSLLDGLEMEIDEVSVGLVRRIVAYGYSEPLAYAALADARDLIVDRLVAEDRRREVVAAREAASRIREGLAHGR